MIVARCVQCDSEFTEEQLVGVSGCPTCGTHSLPCDPKKDVEIKINTHELRVLTIWADNWAQHNVDAQGKKTLSCILQRLSKQLPDTIFTLSGEVKSLQDDGHDAQLINTNGEVLVPSRGKPS